MPAVMHVLIWAYHRPGIINWEKGGLPGEAQIVDYRFCTVRVELVRFHEGGDTRKPNPPPRPYRE